MKISNGYTKKIRWSSAFFSVTIIPHNIDWEVIVMEQNLTKGSIFHNLILFSLPYLLSCFLQSFYGLADLFITGQFNGADAISAVSIGSQVTHMLTLVITGLAMGTTVTLARAIGSGDKRLMKRTIANTVVLFTIFSVITTLVLLLSLENILTLLSTPAEAFRQAEDYLKICFLGIPFITAYNVISAVFRGMGDSRRPMYFIAAGGVINIVLDVILIGPLKMGAAGAALATTISQACSVIFAVSALRNINLGIPLHKYDFIPRKTTLWKILQVGMPIALQEGLIQISFLIITAIANQRGVTVSASVGIVEKIISFLFLVPSAMMSSVSAIAAQNAGAGRHERGRKTLFYALGICLIFGLSVSGICQLWAESILRLFSKGEPAVVTMGAQYLRTYVFDCVFSGIQFCFSGYFCAYGKSYISFLQNVVSVFFIRIPGAYFATVLFPDTLAPMGLASPAGSLFSAVLSILIFIKLRRYMGTPLERKNISKHASELQKQAV